MRVALWLLQDSIKNWSQWIAGFYYVKHCLAAMDKLPEGEAPDVVAFVPESLRETLLDGFSTPLPGWLTVAAVADDLLVSAAGRAEIEKLVSGYRCDVLFPAITPPLVPVDARVIGWIADFQHKYYPGFFSQNELSYRDRLFSFLTATCDRLVSSSGVVQKDFFDFYSPSRDSGYILRFTAEPPGSALVAPESDTTLERFGITQPYAYLPYQFWIHKNHRVVLEAWAKLCSPGKRYSLVCSGATNDSRFPGHFDELRTFIKEQGLESDIKILGLVDRHDQWQLYRNAKMILQPSLFEGWSTSVEESRSLGKPVVLSDIPVHREQVNDTGYFFDPHNSDSLVELIDQLWEVLPAGYDFQAEQVALQANDTRVIAFARSLVQLFHEVGNSVKPKIASHVLPLFLFMQSEAQERLAVIESLSAHLKELQSRETPQPPPTPLPVPDEPISIPLPESSTVKSWASGWFRKRA